MGDSDIHSNGQQTKGRRFSFTGAQATVLVALIGLIGTGLGAAVTGHLQNRGQVELENVKFESTLILKAVELPSRDQSAAALRFFASAGLLPDYEDRIVALSDNQIPFDVAPDSLTSRLTAFYNQNETNRTKMDNWLIGHGIKAWAIVFLNSSGYSVEKMQMAKDLSIP